MRKGQAKIKLFTKSSQIFLIISTILMVVSSIVLYFYVKALLLEEVEEELYSTSDRIVTAIQSTDSIPSLPPVIEVKQIDLLLPDILKDTLIFDPYQDEDEIFKELSVHKEINSRKYRITVRTIIIETEDFLFAIISSYVLIIVLAFLFLYYFSSSWNKKIWRPFYIILEQMRSFSLKSDEKIKPVESEITEFSDLGQQVTILMEQVRMDYENLKQYTEDVSHEIQTPIAVIQAKVENLFDDERLSKNNFEELTSIQQDVKRLSQLNRRLSILAKIDNNQYQNLQSVALSEVVRDLIVNFRELSPMKIKFNELNEKQINIDPFLAELLCNNLLSNAIKHSKPNKGDIEVTLRDQVLEVSNPGARAYADPKKLFARFYRSESTNVKSMGLGLAIVQKICDHYGYRLRYVFENQRHIFGIKFQ